MSCTTVTLTGTGTPVAHPGTAGAGVLVSHGGVHLQFDAGRATTLRLAEAGVAPHDLDAVFLTHHHSDHLTGLADLVLTRWLQHGVPVLPIVAPTGPCTRFAECLLELWDEDLEVRQAHTGRTAGPDHVVIGFDAAPDPVFVWVAPDIVVSAVAVHHEPVSPSVAYRVDTPAGAVVVSGDTRVCDEVLALSRGAQVLVHEACRTRALRSAVPGAAGAAGATELDHILDYHADAVGVGELARTAGVPRLVLTHLIPPISGPGDVAAFEADVRAGGYEGELLVGRDLDRVTFGPEQPR